jgi:hypothetical protein
MPLFSTVIIALPKSTSNQDLDAKIIMQGILAANENEV